MTEETKEVETTEIDHTAENLGSVGQMIIGGIEQIDGILTGDPVTRAEGEFNVAIGSEHQEANKNLTAAENREIERQETNQPLQSETNK